MQCGPTPKHIAFIMDGNRRYAEKKKIKKIEGHRSGFEKMSETLQWCIHFGVSEATVYAFSVDNFKRSKEEVESIMNLARENFQNLLNEEDNIMSNGIKIRVLGNINLLPDDIKELAAKVVFMSKDNNKIFLNIAVAYSSRLEMLTAIKDVVQGVEDKAITPFDITEELLSKCMYSSETPDPDLVIRTSGEMRFSDFLLWQISAACIYFTDQLWPEFSFWNLFLSILYYQTHQRVLASVGQKQLEFSEEDRVRNKTDSEDIFLSKLNEARLEKMKVCLPVECC